MNLNPSFLIYKHYVYPNLYQGAYQNKVMDVSALS